MVPDAVVTVLVDADEHTCMNHLGMSDRTRYVVNPRTGQVEVAR